jgi:hypothetical protein
MFECKMKARIFNNREYCDRFWRVLHWVKWSFLTDTHMHLTFEKTLYDWKTSFFQVEF